MHQGNQSLEWEWGRSKCSVSSCSISLLIFILSLQEGCHRCCDSWGTGLWLLRRALWRGCLLMCLLELQQRLEHGPSLCSLVAQCQKPQEPCSIPVDFTHEVCHQNRQWKWDRAPLIEQGLSAVCLRPTCQYHHRNAPLGCMSKLWRDPHSLYFTHWSVNYFIKLPLLPHQRF